MITRITISSPQYRLQAPSSYKFVKVAMPQRTISVTHMIANTSSGVDPTISVLSAQAISALRIVSVNASGKLVYADRSDLATVNIVGISTTAASSADDPVTVKTSGEHTDPSWSWTVGDIFVGTNGQLTQTPVAGLFVCRVAQALTATKILIDVEPILEL